MRRIAFVALISIVALSGSWTLVGPASAQVKSNDNNIAMMDNCDPSDPTWNMVGGCALKKGSVTVAEFFNLLLSPLYGTIPVGHPSWRNEPSYISTAAGKRIRITNWGGREHTFTKVTNYGGGFVPMINGSLIVAPECDPTTVTIVQPGGTQVIDNLAPGTHKFQCCIHPWMTAAIEVD
jgi:plastocyanin